jgi:hypothetical protein
MSRRKIGDVRGLGRVAGNRNMWRGEKFSLRTKNYFFTKSKPGLEKISSATRAARPLAQGFSGYRPHVFEIA